MLYKTQAIVFRTIRYRESSIILTAFTQRFGIKSYIANSVRTKKPRFGMSLFQPLSLLDMIVYNKENAGLNRISEVRPAVQLATIPYNSVKTAQSLFLAELLSKLINEEHPSPDLFEFIYHAIELFDHLGENYQDFHLQFLLKLSKYLGFSAGSYHPLIRDHIDEVQGKLLFDMLHEPFHRAPVLNGISRTVLLDDILRFYKHHTDLSLDLKSLQVYKTMIQD